MRIYICIFCLWITVCVVSNNSYAKSIFDYDEEVFYPYGIFFGTSKQYLMMDTLKKVRNEAHYNTADSSYYMLQSNGKDYVNPYVVSSMVVKNLLEYKYGGDEEQLKQCIKIMKTLRRTFDRNGCFPRPAYKIFHEGWTSCMDASTIMVASRMLYEITGDEKWHEFVKSLSKYAIKDISEGGFNFSWENGTIWPLEYAQPNLSYDEAYFVLNGSLTGYLGMHLIADVEDDNELKDYLRMVDKTYQGMLPKFPYANFAWTRYMLHPSMVIPPHYAMREMALFNALSHLTKEGIFVQEFEQRMQCIKNVLKPSFKMINGKKYFIVHRATAPHPYCIDVYGTKIVFYDKDDQELQSFVNEAGRKRGGTPIPDFKEGEFLFAELPKGAVRYAYFRSDLDVKLFEDKIENVDFVQDEDSMRICDFTLESAYDAELLEDEFVRIASELSPKPDGRLIYKFHEPEQLDDDNFYGIEIENLSDQELCSGLIIYDSNGTGVGRSYTPLHPGKNLVLFNILGFVDIDRLQNLARIDLRLYAKDKVRVCKLGRLLRFKDLFELRDYRATSGYEIPPQ